MIATPVVLCLDSLGLLGSCRVGDTGCHNKRGDLSGRRPFFQKLHMLDNLNSDSNLMMATICQTSTIITSCYFVCYLLALSYVLVVNQCKLNAQNQLMFFLATATYCLWCATGVLSWSHQDCAVSKVSKLMLFECDILVMVMLQMVFYRMLTLK